jgi:hypothetical protein
VKLEKNSSRDDRDIYPPIKRAVGEKIKRSLSQQILNLGVCVSYHCYDVLPENQ